MNKVLLTVLCIGLALISFEYDSSLAGFGSVIAFITLFDD